MGDIGRSTQISLDHYMIDDGRLGGSLFRGKQKFIQGIVLPGERNRFFFRCDTNTLHRFLDDVAVAQISVIMCK